MTKVKFILEQTIIKNNKVIDINIYDSKVETLNETKKIEFKDEVEGLIKIFCSNQKVIIKSKYRQMNFDLKNKSLSSITTEYGKIDIEVETILIINDFNYVEVIYIIAEDQFKLILLIKEV